MQVYSFTPMDVKELIRPALTPADLARLARADAYHMDAGNGWHIFGQACGNVDCKGYWKITLHVTAPEFRSAIDRACDPSLPCRECQKQGMTGPSLIKYTPKSGSGAGGGGKGKSNTSHRPRKSRKCCTDADIKRMEAELAELCDWLDDVATGKVEATETMIKAAASDRDGLAATIQAWKMWKAVAA